MRQTYIPLLILTSVAAVIGINALADIPPSRVRTFATLSPVDEVGVTPAMKRADGWYGIGSFGWYGAWFSDRQADRTNQFMQRARERGIQTMLYYDGGEIGEVLVWQDGNQVIEDGWGLHRLTGSEKGALHWRGLGDDLRKGNQSLSAAEALLAVARKGLDGKTDWRYYTHPVLDDALAKRLELSALTEKQEWPSSYHRKSGWITNRLTTADYANRRLARWQAEEVSTIIKRFRPDAIHFDNFGENNVHRIDKTGFGSSATRRFDEVIRRLPTEDLGNLGVSDPNSFSILSYIKRRATAWGTRVIEDPLFRRYLVYLVEESARFHQDRVTMARQSARESGIESFAVVGNAIPEIAGQLLGAEQLDFLHFECGTVKALNPKLRSAGLPPRLRLGHKVLLASHVSRSRRSIVNLYVPRDYQGKEHDGLFEIMAGDALAHGGVATHGQVFLNSYPPGSSEVAAHFFDWVRALRYELDRVERVATIAVLHDPWSDFHDVTLTGPGYQTHFPEFAGWCDFLQRNHWAWTVVSSSELESWMPQPELTHLIVPGAACLSDDAWRAIKRLNRRGIRVVSTGASGVRFGPRQALLKRTLPAPEVEGFSRDWFFATPAPLAATYWLGGELGEQAEQPLRGLLNRAQAVRGLHGAIPDSVTAVLTRPEDLENEYFRGLIFLVNHDLDVETDRHAASDPFTLSFPTEWLEMPGRRIRQIEKIPLHGPAERLIPEEDFRIRKDGQVAIDVESFVGFQILILR